MLQMSLNAMKETSSNQTKLINELSKTIEHLRAKKSVEPRVESILMNGGGDQRQRATPASLPKNKSGLEGSDGDVEIIKPAKQVRGVPEEHHKF